MTAADAPATVLRVPDVMTRLQCSRAFVYDHAASLGAVRMGRHLRFTEAGIAAYLERQQVTDAAAEPVVLPVRRREPEQQYGAGRINPVTRRPFGAVK